MASSNIAVALALLAVLVPALSQTCTDGIKNGKETGKDCGGFSGGVTCPKCALGIGCLVATDCVSGFCNGAKVRVCPVDVSCVSPSHHTHRIATAE